MSTAFVGNTALLVSVCVGGVVVFLLLLFLILSIVSLYFPAVCKKKTSLGNFRGKVCSFRGGGGEALEGSLPAFINSASAGADLFITVRQTRDGEVIVFPDRTFSRCCGVSWSVEETLYRFVPRYRPPFFLRYQKAHATQGTCERVISLEQLFQMFPGTSMFLDVRSDSAYQKLIDEIARLVVRYKREKITAWGSHNSEVYDALYEKNPFIPLWVNRRRRFVLASLYYLGLLPFTSIRESVFIIPMPSIVLDKTRGFQIGYLGGWRMWFVDKLLMNANFIRHLKARGIPTYIFCLNQQHEFSRAFRLGATGVVTDCPSALRDYLDKEEEERRDAEEHLK